MLKVLFGGKAAELVLLYLENYGEGYAKAIAQTFDLELSAVQRQLAKFEEGGVVVSQMKGRTRLFVWNPRYAFRNELRALLTKALQLLPDEEVRKYFRQRTRPRKSGKPI